MDIQVENLTKIFGVQRAVDRISFSVKTGEVLGFLGPNGAGKTTAMQMITSYMRPSMGEIKIGGKVLTGKEEDIKRKIGYLPENNPLYPEMPVIDYLNFCAALQGISKEKIPGRIREMVHVCGLNAEKHKKIGELSKGYRQRVGLAQAMIHDPEILIMDEPTSGLDPNQIVEIRKLIRELGRKKTVILSTHILPEVEATCDRILIIHNGKIVADGTAGSLRKQAQGQEMLKIKVEEGETDAIFKGLQELSSVDMVDFADREMNRYSVQSKPEVSSRKDIFQLCVKNNWVLTEMIPLETKLEDIFRELTMN